ncbi:MAG: hypothetical protein GX643_14295 [Acidimicrobiales bacterium]|mgnify:CR=1 FL=1|nr:hypothetical protein [Acidimicrobiales bacterium]
MAITEETRHHLFKRLEEVLGPEEAATMMEHLPPVGWADVATKRDLDHIAERFELRLTVELATVRSELRGEFTAGMTGLRGEMVQLRDDLRSEVKSDMNAMETRLTAQFEALRTEQRQFALVLVAGMVSTLGAVIGLG